MGLWMHVALIKSPSKPFVKLQDADSTLERWWGAHNCVGAAIACADLSIEGLNETCLALGEEGEG